MKVLFSSAGAKNSKKAVVFLMQAGRTISPAIEALDKAKVIANAIKFDMNFKAKQSQVLYISPFEGVSERGIFVVGIGKDPKSQDIQKIGSLIAVKLNQYKIDDAYVYIDQLEAAKLHLSNTEIACDIALGIGMRNYKFAKYYTKKLDEHKLFLNQIHICSKKFKDAEKRFNEHYSALIDGIHLARDLANEPPNVLTPEVFAARCEALSVYGLKIKVLDAQAMQDLGMRALLGVAQGSANSARLVVMEWHGASNTSLSDQSATNSIPLAFIGKGVTFDSGGINLKPSSGMGEMKYDMSGAATVTGLMMSLAKRKAKVDAVGMIGIVENMPSGSAQRPSDVVQSMSGQTIEIDNTDAEGRLVLADVMWYVQNQYKPEVMIDLATLTGAIVVSLGDGYAGLFSNNDVLAKRLYDSGQVTGELLWRLPLGEYYDKQINSDIADIKNTGLGYGAGSITAAQFLKRFVQKECHWAHLDIAGVALAKNDKEFCPKGGSGFGVRLLDEFVAKFYEKK